jgi:hypothetical protein
MCPGWTREGWSGRVDLNHRPPGYEIENPMLSAVESIVPEAQIPLRDGFCQLKCNHLSSNGVEECSTAYQQFSAGRPLSVRGNVQQRGRSSNLSRCI